jgi:hypothetical protein
MNGQSEVTIVYSNKHILIPEYYLLGSPYLGTGGKTM